MAAPTVYDNVARGNSQLSGQLFAGKKFWVAQRVPSRLRYVDLIKTNGGDVVLLEKNADYMIADDVLKNAPPGSTSYKFIEKSIEHGAIQDPDDYPAGPRVGVARTVGSVQPTKATRTPFTPEEDRILYKWVQDQGPGGLVHGNKIYKELEQKYPRHTWQSWRDRYVKRLSNMPPSAFNVPDNAPPSPPSDAPADPQPAPAQAQGKKPTASKPARGSLKRSHSDRVDSVEYTVDDLTNPDLFGKEDWEELYAFAEEIQSQSGETYRKGWEGWAENTRQTAGQWRQYFEKIVMPQWRMDSDEKHAHIRARVERRKDEEAAHREHETEEIEDLPEQNEPAEILPVITNIALKKRKREDTQDKAFESYLTDRCKSKGPSAYVLFARANKWQVWNDEHPELDYVGLHELLTSRWNALANEERAPYLAEAAAANARAAEEPTTISSQAFLSSSTAVNETPAYITEAFEKALDQLNSGMEATGQDERDDVEPPAKKHRSLSPELGTKDDPVEVSSAATDSQQSTEDDLSGDGIVADNMNAIERPRESPTPRPQRSKAAAFDTQAILSSPSQDASLRALPPPSDLNSDASQHTTESLEEFSQLVKEPQISGLAPLVPLEPLEPPPESPQPSSPSSTASGDPDPPLAPTEVDEFFDEQRALGFTNSHIAEALKHTRWRPELAAEVLEAWENGQNLPDKRGVWSAEDDLDVEGGDAAALARLEEKHTMDGWGGITERLNFLVGCRDAEGL